jgi:hypothetical protein
MHSAAAIFYHQYSLIHEHQLLQSAVVLSTKSQILALFFARTHPMGKISLMLFMQQTLLDLWNEM